GAAPAVRTRLFPLNSRKSLNWLEFTPVATTAPLLSWKHDSAQLQLEWPPAHIGWRLQAQTNPLHAGLGTDWFDVADSEFTNLLTLPIAPADSSAFYRLVLP
ncbi:MAG TPA: hypothetical protein PLH97_04460, partial [Verrucomicrobiota bacterium]|nr:hypothetical protein [Verrucomicrobiota bacterium]HPU55516.1 hypothetical protein [Verrucomicrobiota bacterium]